MKNNRRVLIVGTVPYNKKSTSRAFESYFSYWEKDKLAQIFSNTKKPCKGHCATLYQITDKRILDAWFHKDVEPGVVYSYENLSDEWDNTDLEIGAGVTSKMYKIGGKHTPLTHLVRGVLWRKKYWCTDKLNAWLDEFSPECVFLSFSDDYFINKIALYVSDRFQIPIVSCISDDYYFDKHFSINPFYHIYKSSYRQLLRKVIKRTAGAVYISDKIRDKYNTEFLIDGQTVYLTSTVNRRDFLPINKEKPLITYFGNIRMGRNQSLCDIANALGEINSEYRLEVYSNEQDESYTGLLQKNPFVVYEGSIPYDQVQKRMNESDITVVVEGFKEADVNLSRYSLSTKAADTLASGCAILTYGSIECGIVEYMKNTNASAVCTDKKQLVNVIRKLLDDEGQQKQYYDQAIVITNKNHTLKQSCNIVELIIEKAIERGERYV